MKRNSLLAGATGAILIIVFFGSLFVNYSSAQTASSSSLATSTPSAQPPSSYVDSSTTPVASATLTDVQSTTPTPTLVSSSVPVSTPTQAAAPTVSLPVSLPSNQPSSTPANLTASAASASEVGLFWDDPTDSSGVIGYKVYRNGSFVTNVEPSSTVSDSYVDTGLSPATTYTYAVASYDASGDVSAQSNQVSVTTNDAPPLPPSGYPTCDQTDLNVPSSYPTIQAAVNAASPGDTIKVAAGNYNESVSLRSGICLEGAGIDQTVIWKNGASGISGNGVSYVIVQDLTVKYSGCEPGSCGGGGDGGGIWISGSNNVTVQSCRLTGNVAANGGGMFVSGSSVVVNHCLIDGNTASNVGGGMTVESNSTVSLTNVTVANNTWTDRGGNGGVGGVGTYGSNVQVANSILWGNTGQNFLGNNSGVTNSDIDGLSGGTSNISVNPKFISTSNYQLQAGSPAAGMGQ